ncbi:hypothetical protein N7471_001421 [Penicillium samsonianum]|uniref:uncharacterized protein n=1 Tax=Penicillium samsonianum TaxID=1882272 RepID=UPI002548BD21|nr:uncharacterized protein N7471_001421 [Penicillium samsonianum]KAJ6150222.1 hypothetical protein N7471_001421 [Penicillium samsonianum]
MKKFKKAVRRIKARASATREKMRGKGLTMRMHNKATASQVPAAESPASDVLVEHHTMKKFKKAVRRIKARASATRKKMRGKGLTTRKRNKATASKVPAAEVPASEVLAEEVPGLAASAVPHESDQVVDVVPKSKVSHAYSDTPIFYVTRVADDNFKNRMWLQFGKKWESFENRFLADMEKYPPDGLVDRRSPCPFDWLSLKVRAKIWKYAFDDGMEAIFLTKNGMAPKIPTSMRFVSFDWMSEAWFAYINALRNRTLVVMDFPRHGYLIQPCPIFRELATTRVRAIKFALGDPDPVKAKERTGHFIRFMLKHRNSGFVTVRTLIIELRKNWENDDFTERDLADILTCGAFAEIERIRIHGRITNEKLDRFLERANQMSHASF